ncbi:DNA-methyltransferase [Candidatus Palauibacter sp.]|uniref:DNA-methyltransferase n=1 Tax=Candidatus Palauibacter sp. TaxID=3101350 RepID=UPI003B5A2616
MTPLTVERKIKIRAAVNDWISRSFPVHRKQLLHGQPEYSPDRDAWAIQIETRPSGRVSVILGHLLITADATLVEATEPERVVERLRSALRNADEPVPVGAANLIGDSYEFRLGDGLVGTSELDPLSVDLLLTDPPYGISRPYTCENQVPRRLRKNGADFIMPKGSFGDWDGAVDTSWLDAVLPKVRGWAVTFCAQAQIGEYSAILKDHRFVAVGTLVWQKTNPVPFNHKYKPINAWEALVVGKRSGTKFNGRVVHNVFRYKSPAPQHRIHPTQKPLPLIEKFISLFSDEDDLVFDPFAGSATTVLAARNLRRQALAYEKDPTIYHSACARIVNSVSLIP